ncbi:hypothetical protein [Methanolacinia paynteri]|uniref:hypothetical protein n=1 Tax=Methanolacinia paynteri TaxID=230356 RepID=UPI001B80A8C0|nr:hypothetical protein [Methanolacinia paynteri]
MISIRKMDPERYGRNHIFSVKKIWEECQIEKYTIKLKRLNLECWFIIWHLRTESFLHSLKFKKRDF